MGHGLFWRGLPLAWCLVLWRVLLFAGLFVSSDMQGRPMATNIPMSFAGPNMRQLLLAVVTRLLVPPGTGIGGVVESLKDKNKMRVVGMEARKQISEWFTAIRSAPGPDPEGLKSMDDEALAANLNKRVAEKIKSRLAELEKIYKQTKGI